MNGRTRIAGGSILVLLLVAGMSGVTLPSARAQTQVFFEGFEGVFPSARWFVGDSNAASGLVFWNDVDSSFGGEGTHSGAWKGYCAGTGFLNTTAVPFYANSMDAYMQFTNDFTAVSRANFRFWYKMPSIETNFDFARVYVNSNLVFVLNNAVPNWTEAAYSLNGYAGGKPTIRFEFQSDGSVTNEGWYVDDIEVTTGTAPVMDSLVSLALTNYTGYVIDADAFTNNPSYNRESLLVNTIVAAENFQTNSTNFGYQFTYRLRDTNGTLFPLVDSTGLTNGAFTYIATNVLTLAAGGRTNLTNAASLKPAGRLSHLTRYKVEVDVARLGGSTLFSATNGTYQFYHFTNTVSADPAFDVIAEFPTNGLERTWMISLSPGSNAFTVTNIIAMRRYDQFTSTGFILPAFVPLRFDLQLYDSGNNLVPLAYDFTNQFFSIFPRDASVTPTAPVEATNVFVTGLRPASQLNSLAGQYRLVVRVTVTNELSQPGLSLGSRTNGPASLLAFNGNLLFNDIGTTFDAFASPPVPGVQTASYIPVSITIPAGEGTINGETNSHYGSLIPILVQLYPNGDAIYANNFPLAITGPANDVTGNIRFQRSGLVMDTNGARADINFILPAGFGYNTNINEAVGTRRLLSDVAFTGVGLNQSLAPKSNLVLSATMLATEESKPIWFISSAMTWNAANNRFDLTPYPSPQLWHVRIFDYTYLAQHVTNLFDPAAMGVKRCNDGYFTFMSTDNTTPSIRADSGSNALLTADINFGGGAFRTHFPYDTLLVWSNGGRMVITDDAIISGGNSKLTGLSPVLSPYVSACDGCGATGSTNYVGLQPPGGELYFTRDGGLVTSNAVTSVIYSNAGLPAVTGKLAWGYAPGYNAFAQSVLSPTNISFLMPGTFVRGADNTGTDNDGPGVILYTGVASTNFARIERPLTGRYLQGLADYAGMNFRILGDSYRDGKSLIAGQNVDYKLRGNSKYYARLGGVSGIHSAVGGTFPVNLTLLGYSFTFSNYSLAYLDSDNVNSRTEGSIYLPSPSDATFAFKELSFTCPGGLDKAEIQDGSSSNHLAYWNADIEALGIQFVTNPGGECDPGTGWLTVGVRAWMAYVADALHGTIGFKTNGFLIAKSDGVDGVDSRLQVPANFKMGGPNKRDYSITPVGNAYYNFCDSNRASLGFITFAGKMDIPFFEDLKVQVHTTPKKGSTNSPVYLMGGWPRAGSGNPNLGWVDGSAKDYFTAAYFDPNNNAFPTKTEDPAMDNVMLYRNSATTRYHPRAVKLWLDLVDFDYPLVWNDTLRSFKGFSSISTTVAVITASHELTYMDAKTASIDFGIKYDGLPKISLANLLVDELGEATGVFNTITNVLGAVEGQVLDKGLGGLATLLSDSAEKLIDELFDAAVDPLIDTTYNNLHTAYNGLINKSTFPSAAPVQNELALLSKNISNALVVASQGVNFGGKLLSNIDSKLADASNAIRVVNQGLTQGPQIAQMVGGLVDSFASQFSDSVTQPGLDDAIQKIQPSIDQVKGALQNVQGVISSLRGPLAQGQEWQQEIANIYNTGANQIKDAMNTAQTDINTFFNTFNYAVDDPFQHYSPEDFKKKLRKQFKDAFLGTKIVADVQGSIKQRVYDYDAKLRQGLDSYFQQMNSVMRDMISQSLAGVDDTINKAVGDLGQYMGAGKISGHAVINDDALRYLRIDGHFEWKVPKKMEFNAFLEIKEIDSENTAPGCTYAGGTATEVTIGANDVDLEWISSGLHADIEATFVIGNDGTPRGLGGKFQTRGDIEFGGFTIKQIGFAIAFGENDNYLAANVRASFGGSIEIAGGVFFGRTCKFEPLEVALAAVGPDIAGELKPKELFGSPPLTGVFVYAEGTFPIWSVGCLFEVRVTVGAGAWYFGEGPKYGGILKAGVGGTVICVLSASGDITLIGSKKPEGMTFVGVAHVEGCFGPCPFCICVDTSTSVKYVEGSDWDAKDPH